MNPRLRLTLALTALAGGLVNLALLLRTGHPRPEPLAYLLLVIAGVSWSFVGAGLVAWSRRPTNRTGALMVAAGLAFSLNGLRLVGTPLGFALWFLVATLPAAVLAHLIAVFPDGRATTRLQRVFVVANYATTVPLALVQLLLVEPARLGCDSCPDDLLSIGERRPYGEAALAVSGLIEVALAMLLLWIVVARWGRASGPRRRSLAPVMLVGVVLLVLYTIREALLVVVSRPAPFDVGFDLAILTLLLLWPLAFLAGLARTRLDRSAVGDLAIELSEPLPPGRLEQSLARALHDPTLKLAYWLPDRHAFVDAAGHTVDLPAGGDRAVTILRNGGDPVAALLHDPALGDDPALVRAVAATARMTIDNERLHAEVRAQLAEVRASRARIVAFGDAERRRVERNLHDGAQQRLVNLSLALGIARSQLATGSNEQMGAALDEAAAELRVALAELRELARGIHPMILSEAGLGPALAALAERSPIPVTVGAAPPGRLPPQLEETAYYVACEALTNAAKHAHATAVTINARQHDGRLLVVEVGDDGVGGADPDGSGLRGLADRVAALDGRLHVHSPAGAGTRITAELPCGW
jgi:signal transduction histidine kinase